MGWSFSFRVDFMSVIPDIECERCANVIRQFHISSRGGLYRDAVRTRADPKRCTARTGSRLWNESNVCAAFEQGGQFNDCFVDNALNEGRRPAALGGFAALGEQLETVPQIWRDPQGKREGGGSRWRGRHLAFSQTRLLLPKWTLWSSIGVTPHNQVAVDEDV